MRACEHNHRFQITMTKVGKSDWERTFAGTLGNDEDAPQAVALCEIIATAIVTRFSDYSETQPIAVNLGRA